MSKTLTIRTDEKLRAALERRAAAQGKTVSELAREILANALDDQLLGSRTAHLRGGLSMATADEAWRVVLRERNWRS